MEVPVYRSLLSLALVGTLAVAGCSSGDDSQADDAGGAGTDHIRGDHRVDGRQASVLLSSVGQHGRG